MRATSAALDELERALPQPVSSISLRDWPADFPDDIAALRRAPYESRADAIMYRQVLAEVAIARGWEVDRYVAKGVLTQVSEEVLREPRTRLGPPWTKDHRTALAATIVRSAVSR
jgi:hypothetical protein